MDKTKKHILKRAGTCVAVVLMLYLFNRLTNQAFFSQRNLTMLLKQASVLMILTSSLMLLLIETNIDLSGGAGVYLSGVTCALLVLYWQDRPSGFYCNPGSAADIPRDRLCPD